MDFYANMITTVTNNEICWTVLFAIDKVSAIDGGCFEMHCKRSATIG